MVVTYISGTTFRDGPFSVSGIRQEVLRKLLIKAA